MRVRRKELGNKNICGRKIEELRTAKGYKQKYIVEKLAIRGITMNISTLSKIEGQFRQLCDYELFAIAEILEVSAYDLIAEK